MLSIKNKNFFFKALSLKNKAQVTNIIWSKMEFINIIIILIHSYYQMALLWKFVNCDYMYNKILEDAKLTELDFM